MLRRLSIRLGGVAILLLFVWGALHLVIPVIHPDQEVPENHVDGACAYCHIVLDSASIIELESAAPTE